MSTWFRLDDSTPWDPRVLELGVILGDEDKALACLIRLWAWERSGAPTGTVKGEHADAVVERAAGWRGEPGAFARACRETGLLVKTRAGLRSPGNAERLGRVTRRYAGGDASVTVGVTGVTRTSAERQREYRARQRAAKEAANTTQDSVNAASGQSVTPRNGDAHGTVRNADVTGSVQEKEPPRNPSVTPTVTPGVTPTATPSPATPSLTLVPSPPQAPAKATKRADLSGLEAAVFEAWVQTWALGSAYRMTPDRRKVIASRVKEGFTEADLVDAVKGSKLDPWPERPQHIDLAQLLKPTNVPKFAEWHRAGAPSVRPTFDPRKGFVPVASQKHTYSPPAPGEPTRLEDMELMFPEEAQPRPSAPPTPASSAGCSP